MRQVPVFFRPTPISERHATGSLMYDGKSLRGFRGVESFVILFRTRFFLAPIYVYTSQTTGGKVRTFIYKIIRNMVRCPFLPGLDFADPETLKSRLLDLDTATVQTLRDGLQIMVSEYRFLEIQMHLLEFHGRGVREDRRHLVDTYVGELFAQERWERELERPRRPQMKRRPEEESSVSEAKKSALSMQARLAKEREAREKRATARREQIEAERRTEQALAQEREATQLLELVAQMQLRHEAASGLSGFSGLARDRELRATAHREHLQREARLAEEREAEELRKLYAMQASRRW